MGTDLTECTKSFKNVLKKQVHSQQFRKQLCLFERLFFTKAIPSVAQNNETLGTTKTPNNRGCLSSAEKCCHGIPAMAYAGYIYICACIVFYKKSEHRLWMLTVVISGHMGPTFLSSLPSPSPVPLPFLYAIHKKIFF